MGVDQIFLAISLSLTLLMAPAKGYGLCDFEKMFEHVRSTQSNYSKSNAYSTPTSKSASNTHEVTRVPNVTTTGIDCLEIMESNVFTILNGSSTVNYNCTKMITCTDGEISVDRDYYCSTDAVCDTRNDVRRCYCISNYHGDGENCTKNSSDCQDILNSGYTSDGVYSIQPSNWDGPPFNVYCNMSTDGGWTVFQHRFDGSVDFYRNWTDYKVGFGEVDKEHWLGNDKLYYLTNQGNYSLWIDLVTSYGGWHYAEFDLFRINSESDNYSLTEVGTYTGNAEEDGLSYHLNCPFSTFDRDNDDQPTTNCAEHSHGGWWYKSQECHTTNLNGNYHAADLASESIFWRNLPQNPFNIKYTEMKIRPKT